jgi:hypothetical protein
VLLLIWVGGWKWGRKRANSKVTHSTCINRKRITLEVRCLAKHREDLLVPYQHTLQAAYRLAVQMRKPTRAQRMMQKAVTLGGAREASAILFVGALGPLARHGASFLRASWMHAEAAPFQDEMAVASSEDHSEDLSKTAT